MNHPISTGQAARLLQRTEPQLAELVRRGRIKPPPAIFAGRRLWEAHHLRQAAELLGITDDAIRTALDVGTIPPIASAPEGAP